MAGPAPQPGLRRRGEERPRGHVRRAARALPRAPVRRPGLRRRGGVRRGRPVGPRATRGTCAPTCPAGPPRAPPPHWSRTTSGRSPNISLFCFCFSLARHRPSPGLPRAGSAPAGGWSRGRGAARCVAAGRSGGRPACCCSTGELVARRAAVFLFGFRWCGRAGWWRAGTRMEREDRRERRRGSGSGRRPGAGAVWAGVGAGWTVPGGP